MAVINLVEIKIHEMLVDWDRKCVFVRYSILDDQGRAWGDMQTETYWATMPAAPEPTDVKLPTTYIPTFTNLHAAALAALKSKYI